MSRSKRPMSEIIFQALRAEIITGQLQPNERILELEIAKRFQSSQAPVREALQRLQEHGLILSAKYSGTFVAPISSEEMRDIFELRNVVEKQAIKSLHYRLDEEALNRLRQSVDSMEEAAGQGDLLQLVEHDMAFHQCLIELSGKPMLSRIWSYLDAHVRRFLVISHPVFFQNLLEVAAKHRSLLETLESKDTASIEAAYDEHLILSWDQFMQVLGR